ncbi:MAG TPA: DPP IV N-terminal domain-containing protein, partial [Pedobacter sp.]|nr:DPP IV N-terminal domain-containing protein [Pedobacter sp.]
MKLKLLFLIFLSTYTLTSTAQGKKEDYQRAEFLNGAFQDKIHHAPNNFKWLSVKQQYFYSILTARGTEYITVNAKDLQKNEAFDQHKLAQSLTTFFKKPFKAYELPLARLTIDNGGNELEFSYENKTWNYDLSTFAIKENNNSDNLRFPGYWGDQANEQLSRKVKSPDGKWIAYIKNFNVFIQATAGSNEEFQLSFDGSEGEYYQSNIVWSPDSKKLATNKVRPNKPHLIYLIESSPTTQLQPILQSRNYLKPGDALPQMQPSLFLVDTKKQIQIDNQ